MMMRIVMKKSQSRFGCSDGTCLIESTSIFNNNNKMMMITANKCNIIRFQKSRREGRSCSVK